jgi:hypothetical protein
VSFARAEEPLPPPSLKWTAIVAPSSDDASLAAAEVPDAEDVRAVRDLHRGAGDVAVGDERQAVRADRQRRVPADRPGGVDGGRGRRRAGDVDAVGELQVEVRPAAVVVGDDTEAVDADRADVYWPTRPVESSVKVVAAEQVTFEQCAALRSPLPLS